MAGCAAASATAVAACASDMSGALNCSAAADCACALMSSIFACTHTPAPALMWSRERRTGWTKVLSKAEQEEKLGAERLGTHLAEDDVGVRGRRLEDVRLRDDEQDLHSGAGSVSARAAGSSREPFHGVCRDWLGGLGTDVLALLHRAPDDAGHRLHPELLHRLPRLLLAA